MPQPSPILGGHGQSRSLNLADNQCINLFLSVHETKDGKAPGALYMTPGLDLLVTVGSGPIRALWVAQGVLYVVSGTGVYSVSSSWQVTQLGTIGTGAGPVSVIDSGSFAQVAFFDGAAGYLWDVNTLTFSTLSLPFSGPVQATYQDDFGLVSQVDSQVMWQSNPGDLSTWNALNYSAADGSADNIVAIISMHRELWVLKQYHTEVWVDQGSAGFAFGRLDGTSRTQGCVARWSVAVGGADGEALFWLSSSPVGEGRVLMVQGYVAQTISTVAMAREIAGYSVISDAIGYCYEQEGESFYVLTFPTAGVTWCYAARAGTWHKRASFQNGQWGRHWGNAYASFSGRCVVGDYRNGNLYAYNLDQALDNGQQRKWLRSWRGLIKPTMQPMRYNYLTIDMETGMQVQPGSNPQVMLRWSDDGGHNWSDVQWFFPAGETGRTAHRVKFNRLGSTRRNGGLDRIFELSSSDPFKVAILGAEIG